MKSFLHLLGGRGAHQSAATSSNANHLGGQMGSKIALLADLTSKFKNVSVVQIL